MIMAGQTFYDNIHYNIGPPFLIATTNIGVQLLAVYGTALDDVTWSLVGNTYSWTAVGLMFLWAYLSLVVPSKDYKGPTSPAGHTPVYSANGLQYFFVTLIFYAGLLFFAPQSAIGITKNFPQIIATLNVIALVFCWYLLRKGKTSPEVSEKLEEHPIIYEFYRGMEIHPRMMGVDIKQLIICRFSMAAWFLLAMVFFVANCLILEFSLAYLMTVILIIVYLGKFFWWETGYFNTIDVMYDRAGYYLIWGCIVFVPSLFTFSWYFLVNRPILIGDNGAFLILFFGLISIALTYWVDFQKEHFRNNGGRCRIWCKQATFVLAPYKTDKGVNKKSYLLTSGFWGIARHLNYTFELMSGLSWCLSGIGYGIWPFLYIIFLTALILHRVFRDEKKCAAKYGKTWTEYCQKVPYRMIPGIF